MTSPAEPATDAGGLDAAIDRVLAESNHLASPYLSALANGELSKDDFLATQGQFYFAVVFFSRPMAAVAAKIPDAKRRTEVLRNVWEEHGEGTTRDTHGTTFLEFLERVGGVTPAQVEAQVLWPEVRQFNTTLTGACVMDEYLVGVGVMGMIERMFADISAFIGNAVVERGWLERERMIHYSLHAELDVRHAADFFDVVRPEWNANAGEGSRADRYAIEQGLRLGAHAFMALYEGLWRARERRWRIPGSLGHGA